MTGLILPLELGGNDLIYGTAFLRSHVQAITKEWHFVWQWLKMNEGLVRKESGVEGTGEAFFLKLSHH